MCVFHNQQLSGWDTPLGNECLAHVWQHQQIPPRFLRVPGGSPKLLQLDWVRLERVKGRGASRLPLHPQKLLQKSPKVPDADNTQWLCQNKAAGWERWPRCKGKGDEEPREDIIGVPEVVARSASWSWISIWTMQLPLSSCSQGNGWRSWRAKQLTGLFFCQLSVYDVDRGWK